MWIILLLVSVFHAKAAQRSDYFIEVQTCSNTSETIFETLSVVSQVECGRLCLMSDDCSSFRVDVARPRTCYLNTDTMTDTGCSDGRMKHYNSKSALDKSCLHGGLYNSSDMSCRCYHGYVGDRCERLMKDCSEGLDSGHYNSMHTTFKIHPVTSPEPFVVWCDMYFGGQTVLMKKRILKSYVDFNRTWEEYKNGFGDMVSDGNFWLGNERLNYVTNHREMTLYLMIYAGGNWTYKQHIYKHFRVDSEGSGFQCNYDFAYSNTGNHSLGDCFANQKLMSFTTFDKDNDQKSGGNCARIHLSGWWYSDCGECNPTGKLQPVSEILQNSDPTYVSMPIDNLWAPREIHMYLVYES